MKKWKTTPVIVSFDSEPQPIWNIPFPALTLCNNNKVQKSKVTNTNFNHRLVNEICNKPIFEVNETHADLNGQEIHGKIKEIAQPCDELLIR